MSIGIIFSETGAGKSRACCGWEEPIHIINCEDGELDKDNRLKSLIDNYFSDRIITIHHVIKLHDRSGAQGKLSKIKFDVDGIASLKNFIIEVNRLVELKPIDFPRTLIIDGITPLRDWAHDTWCVENDRQQAMNPGDWEAVNDIVRLKLRPLVLWAKRNGINLVMTAQMKDEYETIEVIEQGKKKKQSVRTGRIANIKEWQAYQVNWIVELIQEKGANKRPTGKFTAVLIKMPVDCTKRELDITDKSLYDELVELGV